MEQIPRSHLFKNRSIQRRADLVAKEYDEMAKHEQDLKILRNKLVLDPRDSGDYNIFICTSKTFYFQTNKHFMYLFNLNYIPVQPFMKYRIPPTLISRKPLTSFSPTKWILP